MFGPGFAAKKEKLSLIWALAKNDFISKYSSSQLGVFWAFFRPVVMAGVYIFVFTIIARSGAVGSGYPYALWLLPGLIAWFAVSDSISTGTPSLGEYSYLVKKVRFDVTILPIVKVGSAFIVHAFFVVFILLVYLLWGMPLRWQMLQIPYYMLCSFSIGVCVSRITCALYPFFRDITSVVEILLMVLIWATPVMWDTSMLPEQLQFLFLLNPFYYLVMGYRDSYMGLAWFWEHPWLTLYFWAVIIVLSFAGRKLFRNLMVHFADIL